MSSKLFGTDGIRGRYGKFPLDEKTIFATGLALGEINAKTSNPNVLLGMDTRESGPEIVQILAAGLKAGGAASEFAGVNTTPGIAYSTEYGEYSMGVMVSASHNSFEDNGIKVFDPFGYKIPDEEETRLEERILGLVAKGVSPSRMEGEEDPQIVADYVQHLLRDCDLPPEVKRLKFVVDCANGAASQIAPLVLDSLCSNVTYIAQEPNGRNINLDCGALQLDALSKQVVATKADFGVAFDGDADRCMLVDEQGIPLNGDNLLLLAAISLKKSGYLVGNTVVATVMSNMGLELALQKEGIRLVRTDVGDKHVIHEMLRSGAALGGEQSGHIIFGDLATTGDGLLTLCMMLRILAEESVPCSKLRERLQVLPQEIISVRVSEKKPLRFLPEISQLVSKIELKLAGRGRVNIRYSGTEPVVRVMVEAERAEDVVRHSSEIAGLFEQHIGI